MPRPSRYQWVNLPDKQLLELRLCDLGLRLESSLLARRVRRLHAELAAKGLRFRPHAWLSSEWFSPDGVPGVAMPFYLAHPRLERLERAQMFEVEGESWMDKEFSSSQLGERQVGWDWFSLRLDDGRELMLYLMRAVDILYALPFMFLVILLMVLFGRNIVLIFVAIGAINWLDMARIVRGQTLSLKNREFVEAARAGGVPAARIIRRHVVPNLLGIVVVYVTLTIPHVIMVESFLSFLGLGVEPPTPSWGSMLNDGRQFLLVAPHLTTYPGLALMLTVLALNIVGDALQDRLATRNE